jgi:hypothetical protein
MKGYVAGPYGTLFKTTCLLEVVVAALREASLKLGSSRCIGLGVWSTTLKLHSAVYQKTERS